MKVYLVESIPNGDFFAFLGIFSTKDKAKETVEKWLQENPEFKGDTAWEPSIEEVIVDEYHG